MKKTDLSIPELMYEHEKQLSISVEVLPPIRGKGIDSIFQIIVTIKDIHPLWIDVTNHSPTTEWIPDNQQDFFYRKNVRRKSPGTIAICGAINFKYNIPAVPHLLCHGFTREETEDGLIDLNYLGIKNILAIRGDGHYEKPHTLHAGNDYALDLIHQIQNMNQGNFLDQQAQAINFCIGAACYPEKHFESPNLTTSNRCLAQKQKHGVSYAVSQMFFNNEKFHEFYQSIKEEITIPVIPGLKILSSPKQLHDIPKRFFIEIPQQLVENMHDLDKAQAKEIGIEWTYQQCLDLIEHGHNHLHFYIMRNTDLFLRLISKLNDKFKFIR